MAKKILPKTTKVWKSTKNSPSAMEIGEESAKLVGSEDNLIVADGRGITIMGPLSLVTDAHNIRRGGLFVGMNDFTDMIPSTIVTPLPKQIPLPPVHGVLGIAQDVAFFQAFLV